LSDLGTEEQIKREEKFNSNFSDKRRKTEDEPFITLVTAQYCMGIIGKI
jgi:hypothetical protein